MIQLYSKGTTDFSKHGISLHPSEGTVTFQENGQYDLEIVIPVNSEYTSFDYGQILRATVPTQKVDAINLGTVAYYSVTNASGTNLYSVIPTLRMIGYNPWIGYTATEGIHVYEVGDKVTYNNKNYQCNYFDSDSQIAQVPPDNSSWWDEIPRWSGTAGSVIEALAVGTAVMKVQDFSAEYIEVATLDGYQGYVKTSDCAATGDTETRTIPAWTIKEQNFIINEIRKEQQGQAIRITAEHVSYALGRTILGECSVVNVTPMTAMRFVAGAMKEAYGGELYTNVTEPEITADWSWKNAQAAILDPKAGILNLCGGRIIRDNLDVYVLTEGTPNVKYSIRYGVNMRGVKWDGDVSNIVTRIYPIAKTADGQTLTLPEEHIDTVRQIPFIRPEVLDTKLKVGQKETASDGTETELTEAEIFTRMRDAAANRYNVDKCDQAEVKLELDWVHMPDTAEYAQYAALINAAPGEWVEVVNGPLGISEMIRMTEYRWDPIMNRYKGATFGSLKVRPTVAGYNLQTGSVTSRAIAGGAVGNGAIQAGSITATEIAAHSITADKIASKSITAEIIAANTITANEISANAITAEKIAANAIKANHLDAEAVTARAIAAGSILADKIASGAVTTAKLDAYAVTAEKIASGAVTADKIDAGAITAEKISATDLTAINAKLGTADIADARIGAADISFAKVKDLNAQSAYFGQAVIQEGLANKLFIPRLSVVYAQIVSATIGDLVIQATDEKFYKLDVDLSGNVTATEITPTSQEIENGHTADGRTIYLGTDIVAEDLNTTNIYASHALMDEITANIINVDQLFAREATIGKINALDLSSNTYIRSTIGNWTSGSTITQTINSLDTRIASLGYGTVYMQPDEPNHSELSSGDIWIQTLPNASWNDVLNSYTDWQEIADDVSTWQLIAGMPKMFVWDGLHWQEMYDSLLPTTTQTQIQQLSDAISLKADSSRVDALGNTVDEFSAELTIQAEQIAAAVSSVNTKASSYIMWADPRTIYTVSIGDIWIKEDLVTSTWQDVADGYATWNAVNGLNEWLDLLGADTFVWDGAEWIQTSDRATEVYNETRIIETEKEVTILATQSANFQDTLITVQAQLRVTADRISAEVTRAQYAEDAKISKTTAYQTADDIVTEVLRQVSGSYIAKTSVYQDAASIVATAEEYADNGFYAVKSGISILAAGIEISGGKYIQIKSGGSFSVESGNFSVNTDGNVRITGTITAEAGSTIGGWTLGANSLHAGTGSGYVGIASSGDYAFWAGSATDSSAPFRVKPDGTVYLTKLMIVDQDGQNPTEFNAYSTLWKLWYATVKAVSVDNDGYCTSMTFSNGIGGVTSVNFNTAATARANGWTAAYMKVVWPEAGTEVTMTVKAPASSESSTPNQQSVNYAVDVDNDYAYIKSGTIVMARKANPAYANGNSAGQLTGWSEAYGKVSWPTQNTSSASMTVKAPAATKASNPNQQSVTYTLTSDDNVAYIKNGTVVMAQLTHNKYSAGNSAGQVTGWNDCRDAATLVERYTRSAGTYGGNTTHYVYDSQNSRYISVGNNWYQTTRADAYLLPSAK